MARFWLWFAISWAGTMSVEGKYFAVGDIHGDYAQFVGVLQELGVIDAEEKWIAGDSKLFQVGDMLDRGPDDERLLSLIMSLQAQASSAGGEYAPIMANHEQMNIREDWRFATDGPEPTVGFGSHERRRQMLAANTTFGDWLRQLPGLLIWEDVLFNHAGLSEPLVAKQGLDKLNAGLYEEVVQNCMKGPLTSSAGPISQALLWDRTLMTGTDDDVCPRLKEVLDALGVKRMVVGHCPTGLYGFPEGAIGHRCDKSVYFIDVGIGRAYFGARNALIWDTPYNGLPPTALGPIYAKQVPTPGTIVLTPSLGPTEAPTLTPTTREPTPVPTLFPTIEPILAPGETHVPTPTPTHVPTMVPTLCMPDKSSNCPYWGSSGECWGNGGAYAREYCPTSCGANCTAPPITLPSLVPHIPVLPVDAPTVPPTLLGKGLITSSPTSAVPSLPPTSPVPSLPPTTADEYLEVCADIDTTCGWWVEQGFCKGDNAFYMTIYCRKACGFCGVGLNHTDSNHTDNSTLDVAAGVALTAVPTEPATAVPTRACFDEDVLHCGVWAVNGYCEGTTREYMAVRCKRSCRVCIPVLGENETWSPTPVPSSPWPSPTPSRYPTGHPSLPTRAPSRVPSWPVVVMSHHPTRAPSRPPTTTSSTTPMPSSAPSVSHPPTLLLNEAPTPMPSTAPFISHPPTTLPSEAPTAPRLTFLPSRLPSEPAPAPTTEFQTPPPWLGSGAPMSESKAHPNITHAPLAPLWSEATSTAPSALPTWWGSHSPTIEPTVHTGGGDDKILVPQAGSGSGSQRISVGTWTPMIAVLCLAALRSVCSVG